MLFRELSNVLKNIFVIYMKAYKTLIKFAKKGRMVGRFTQNIAIYSFFAFVTAKSAAKPVVKPIKAKPISPMPSVAIV
jgi:hypothetical protein